MIGSNAKYTTGTSRSLFAWLAWFAVEIPGLGRPEVAIREVIGGIWFCLL
jgi:hypothetical protein